MNELDLFTAAIAIKGTEVRRELLERECAGNAELRQRLERLVAAHFEANILLDQQAVVTVDRGTSELPGHVIGGKYKLLEEIGEGGMGTVWVAEQTEPVRRKVALKLIKAGMDSKSVLARFEAERQALAVMDHPNIAKVLDGGVTDTGRPYFVMEYVKGVPITEYCDATRLSVQERLNLFVQVCQAVQHAHQKGIIHRDLKPSNILVAPYDDLPVPKVIDFGLAKAMHQSLTEKTLHTAHETVLGTPLYMSPEQAQLNNIDVDTRSDIYSLGVLLYELLTGTTPLEKQRFKEAAWDEIKRIIRDEEPPRPSMRISSTATLPSLAACRQIEPAKLTKLVRGELDWIVMKSLEKDRMRRYETASGFAADVQRYLSGEAVLAAPPSTAYRFKKFVRRNRPQVIAVSLVLLALVAGIIGTTLGLIEARRQAGIARDEATAKEQARLAAEKSAAAEKAANVQTQKRLAQIEKGVELFAGMLAGIDPRSEEKDGKPLYEQLRERAEKAADQLQAEAVGDPLAEARLQTTLGLTLERLGSYAKAIDVLERARATGERELGADHPDTLITLGNLAAAYHGAGRTADAIALFEHVRDAQVKKLGADHLDTLYTLSDLGGAYLAAKRSADALALLEPVRDALAKKLGADHPHTLTALNSLARAYQAAGRTAEAIALMEQVRDALVKNLGADHHDTLAALNNLAAAYLAAGRTADCIPILEQVHDAFVKKLGADHPHTLTFLNNLAAAYKDAGRTAEAIALFEQARDGRVKKLGVDHPDTLRALHNLALAYQVDGRTADAIPLFEQVRDAFVKTLGADHPDTLTTFQYLALAYKEGGKLPEAIALHKQVRDAQMKKLGADHPDTLTTLHSLAVAYRAAGRTADAIPLFEQVRDGRVKKLGADHPDTLNTLNSLAVAYRAAGRTADAIPLFEQVRDGRVKKLGDDHPDTLTFLNNLADAYKDAGRTAEAIALFEKTRDAQVKKLGADHPHTLTTLHYLADAYWAAGRTAEAIPVLEQVRDARVKALGADHPHTLKILNNLAAAYWSLERLDQSIPLFEDVLARQEKKLGRQHPDTLRTVANLGVNYRDAGRLAEAIPLLEEAYRAAHPAFRVFGPELLNAYGKAGKSAEAIKLIGELLADARKQFPKDSPQLAGELAQFGLRLLGAKGFTEAEPLLRESLAIREKEEPDAWTTFNTQSMLGGALLGLKKYADAEPMLVKGYEGMKAREETIPPQASARIPEALDRLIELYTATDKPEEVKKWQAERAKYPQPASPQESK